MEFLYIDTPRLRLRLLDDEQHLQILNSASSDSELALFFGLSSEEEIAAERAKAKKGVATYNRFFRVFHILEPQSGKNIGWCGFHSWYIEHRRAEIGYGLRDTAHWGKGYMSEVLPFVLRYGFETLQLHRIEAFIGPENLASLRLVERLGFLKEGHLREHYFKHGRIEDSLVYGLIKVKSEK